MGQQLPRHGTLRRYRLELKTDAGPCDRCKAANSKAKANERANRKARERRAQLSLVPDPQDEPTTEAETAAAPTPAEPKRTEVPTGHLNLTGPGIENAVRNYLNSISTNDLLANVYGEIVISLSKVIAISEPKDIPKLAEEMVDAAKLMRPAGPTGGGDDDPFSGFGQPS